MESNNSSPQSKPMTSDSEAQSEAPSVEELREEFEIELVRAGVNADNVDYDILAEVRQDFSAKINRLIVENQRKELSKVNSWVLGTAKLNDASNHKWYRYFTDRDIELSNNLKDE